MRVEGDVLGADAISERREASTIGDDEREAVSAERRFDDRASRKLLELC